MGLFPLDFTKLPVGLANDRAEVLAALTACVFAYVGHKFASVLETFLRLPCSFNELMVLWLTLMGMGFLKWRQNRNKAYYK